jgi:hypothetical protein
MDPFLQSAAHFSSFPLSIEFAIPLIVDSINSSAPIIFLHFAAQAASFNRSYRNAVTIPPRLLSADWLSRVAGQH